jgi:uncharacterized protein (DUF433 family)
MSELHRVTVDPDQCGGRPCIRGLRIRVKDVLDLLAAGASRDEIVADYPLLEPEDITAALEYAARQSDHPVLPVAWCVFWSMPSCHPAAKVRAHGGVSVEPMQLAALLLEKKTAELSEGEAESASCVRNDTRADEAAARRPACDAIQQSRFILCSCRGWRRSRDKEPWSPTQSQPSSRFSIAARLPAWKGLISRRPSRVRPSCMSSVSSTFAPACMEAAHTTQSHS